ncbi:MAG: GMC family oxidoreductase N-terminal domain-containing protein [Gammaproteobacteria bacterium]|jgi:choline dehydrogenase|nr:GMC family oxidoreductase N-terminal domain-containing protein [Gammaproteobacteria bacterium]
MMKQKFDYIVVGAGSAGALLANRLSADSSKRVLLLEAGGKDNYHWIHIPVGYLYCIDNPRTDWQFHTEPEAGLNGRSLLYPRGKTLGGCSSINGMIYMRGQARDYDQWAQLSGDAQWSWAYSLEDFKAHEDYYRLDQGTDDLEPEMQNKARLHGSGGEWRVEKQRLRWEILEAYAKAAVQLGIPATDDFNGGDNTGVGYFDVNQRSGWRWNTSKAFLRPIKSRSNLEIWTHAQVTKLNLGKDADGHKRCTSVDVSVSGQVLTVEANCEVILSAGAIGSPHIMQLSGIGSAQHLARVGIKVTHELEGVGSNLQDHLQIRTVYGVEGVKTLNKMASTLMGKASFALEYALKRSGPMSMAPSQLGIFTKSDTAQEHANIEFHVQPLSLEAFGQPLHDFPAITASVCNLNPTSRGTVLTKSSDPFQAPAIAPNYLTTEEDRKVAADSLRVVRDIAQQQALAEYCPTEIKPGKQFQTDAELAQVAGDIASTIFHPVGTTKMGKKDDPAAVVDSKLRVYGIRGLRVVDAGIMPTITSGNTNSPTLMIAEKAARWILQDN